MANIHARQQNKFHWNHIMLIPILTEIKFWTFHWNKTHLFKVLFVFLLYCLGVTFLNALCLQLFSSEGYAYLTCFTKIQSEFTFGEN